MKRLSGGLVLATLLILLPSHLEAASNWLVVESPHFTAVSADSESTTRAIVWQFEQIRSVAENLWPWTHVQVDRPVFVFMAPNEETMKMLLPAYWENKNGIHPSSLWTESFDRYYIVLRSDFRAGYQDGVNPFFDA